MIGRNLREIVQYNTQSTRVSVASSELALPSVSPAIECVPPPGTKGVVNTRLRVRGVGSQFGRLKKAWHSVYSVAQTEAKDNSKCRLLSFNNANISQILKCRISPDLITHFLWRIPARACLSASRMEDIFLVG
jgi:hypothetical protein